MDSITLRKAVKGDYKWLKKLYCEAFPTEERAPFFMLRRGCERNCGDYWVVIDHERPVGMAYVLVENRSAYLFYLAVAPEERGRGYGHQIIRLLTEQYSGSDLFLALEDVREKDAPNLPQRLSRHAFYESCGLHDYPCFIHEGNVTYAVMGTGKTADPEVYARISRRWAGPLFYRMYGMRVLENRKDR